VTRQGDRLAGKRVRVKLLEDGHGPGATEPLLFYATATREEWIHALREYAASQRRDATCLSDEAISRESIYFADE